jgi:geranylgeranyl reductase family protein
MWDFVVVGAGPAGSRFARSAAERGRSVLVLEKGEVGKPLACSGHVSLDLWEFVPERYHDELFQNAIHGARFHLDGPESDGREYPFYRDEPISNAVDRVCLDQVLAEVAGEAGADVRPGHTVTSVEERHDRVVVEATGPDGVDRFESRMVVGADGPRSRVRQELGLPGPEEFLHGVLGFDPDPDHQEFVDVHLTVPRFFAWRIPRGDAGVEYGLAVAPGDDAPGRFEELCEGYDISLAERCSGLIPIGPPETVTSDRALLVGDAAAQTKPFTGGGILYGMRAADVAAREVDPNDPTSLGRYELGWRAELARDQWLGKVVRAGYSFPEPLQRLGMRVFSGKVAVHMDRPSTLFSPAQLRALLE